MLKNCEYVYILVFKNKFKTNNIILSHGNVLFLFSRTRLLDK
jgi:hypothetical protein